MIDILTHILLPMSNNFIVNFGGDIRVRGTHTIFLEDPRDTTQKL